MALAEELSSAWNERTKKSFEIDPEINEFAYSNAFKDVRSKDIKSITLELIAEKLRRVGMPNDESL